MGFLKASALLAEVTGSFLPGLVECPHCHRPMMSHHVCPACGFYRGRDVLGIESDSLT